MKVTALAAFVFVAGAGVNANAAGSKDDPILKSAPATVQICSQDTADIGLNFRARSIATQIFAGIGVSIEWRHGNACLAGALRISYSTSTPAKLMPHALAYALPYEGTHIVIFYDRIQAAVVPERVPALLGHVLAHEVTHIVEGISRHSADGVLKARWTNKDYSQMSWKPLKFADEDIVLIHSSLQRSAAR